MNYNPQVTAGRYIKDTSNWVEMGGVFKADSAFKYLTISHYGDSLDLDVLVRWQGSNSHNYYYIDSVTLIKIQDALRITGDSVLCSYGDSVLLHATSSYNSYRWYDASDFTTVLSTDTQLYVRPDTTTTYAVINEEWDTAYFTLWYIEPFKPDLGPDTTFCSSDTLVLRSTSAPWPIRWQWSSSDTTDSTLVVYNTGIVWVEARDTLGCLDRDTIRISWVAPPQIFLSNDTSICVGDTALISLDIQSTLPYTLSWGPIANTLQPQPDRLLFWPGQSEMLTVSVEHPYCAAVSDSVLVTVRPRPVTTISAPDTICRGTTISLIASGGDLYHWSHSSATKATLQDQPGHSSLYMVTAELDGCLGNPDSTLVFVDTLPIAAEFTVQPLQGFTTFTPLVSNTSMDADLYLWDFGNGQQSSITIQEDLAQNRQYQPVYTRAGDYTIQLIASRPSSGCADSASARILVEKKFILFVPNAFSPNGDGHNDIFALRTSDGVRMHGAIYNRWGELVFEFHDATQFQWDGNYQGAPLPQGVYTYQLSLQELDGTLHHRSGTITLLR